MLRLVAFSLLAWLLVAAGLRLTVLHAETCPPLGAGEARASAAAAGDGIVRNHYPDCSYVYEYDREADSLSASYTVVRHAGVTMSLYQLVRAGESDFLGAADLGLSYMQASLIEVADWTAFRSPIGSRVSLGANALLLAGLSQRRLATGEPNHDRLMKAVGRFILTLQQPDGSMLSEWDPATGATVPGATSRYATGEAFWALALLAHVFPGEGWDRAALSTGRYLATRRDEAEGLDFPPWADQWAAYGFAELEAAALGPEETRYVRSLAERFGFLVRVESRRGEGRLTKLLQGRRARAAGLGTWVEGRASLWALSLESEELGDLTADIAERTACAAGMLAERQVGRDGSAGSGLLDGAWFTNGATRMDDQQHALSGLLLTEPILRSRQ